MKSLELKVPPGLFGSREGQGDFHNPVTHRWENGKAVRRSLDEARRLLAEAGAMMYMTRGIEMQTVFGDPSKNSGLMGKIFEAGKRMVTGESMPTG